MDQLNIISLNARGLNSDDKRLKLKKDIYNRNWDGIIVDSYSDSQFSRGVSVLFKKNLDIDIIDKHSSFDGRIIVLNLKINEKCFTFVNVYAPNDDKTKHAFFEKLKKYITQHAMYMENM